MSVSERTRRLALSGLLAAIIFMATAYIHVPTGLGYTHIGDGFIFLAAALLPLPYAAAAAMGGAAAADIACGMAVWAPATLVIKGLMVLSFTSRQGRVLVRRNYIALIPALLLNIIGYSLYEALVMTESAFGAALAAAFAQTPFYTVQTLIGAAIFTAVGRACDSKALSRRLHS